MERLEAIVGRLPEAQRVDIEAWGDEPTYRVNGKNWVRTSYTLLAPKRLARLVQ